MCVPFGVVVLAGVVRPCTVDVVGGSIFSVSYLLLSQSLVFVAVTLGVFFPFADLLGYLGRVSFGLLVLLSCPPRRLLAAYPL